MAAPTFAYEVSYKKKFPRKKLLRIFWSIPFCIPMMLWQIWVTLLFIAFIFEIVVHNQRNKRVWEQIVIAMKYYLEWSAYIIWITDEKPAFWPWNYEVK
jgi:hypothetical protein